MDCWPSARCFRAARSTAHDGLRAAIVLRPADQTEANNVDNAARAQLLAASRAFKEYEAPAGRG